MSRARTGLLALLLTMPQLGCDQSPLSPSERRQLELARARWAQHGGPDYTVESRASCFCPPDWSNWTRVTVRGGVVVQVEAVDPLPGAPTPSIPGWPTVEEVFASISNANSEYIRELTVRFDPDFGYPLEVGTICKPEVLDCGGVREMRNLRIP